ncbi:Protein of unknown function [Escherichia coli D6-117.29]|nr:Protein of unknown function [Escherichia coli]CDP75279.1 Protein of unknown function [Escherichia coli D6-117.29]CDU37434.1 Protein of unknown function [Escherichia coli]
MPDAMLDASYPAY